MTKENQTPERPKHNLWEGLGKGVAAVAVLNLLIRLWRSMKDVFPSTM